MNSKQHTALKPLLPRTLAFATILFLSMTSLEAQESLQAKLRALGADWIVGEWKGTNSQGVEITLEYEWELNGHSLEIELEMVGDTYKGMIFYHPLKEELIETGGDNNGGMTRAIWDAKDGVLTSRRTATRLDRETVRIAVVSRRSDDETTRATVHPLSEAGEIGEEPIDTVTLTRVDKEAQGD